MRDKTDHSTFELPGFEPPAMLPIGLKETRRANAPRRRRPAQMQEGLLFSEADPGLHQSS